MVNRSFDFYFLNMYDKMKADLGLYGFHAIKPLYKKKGHQIHHVGSIQIINTLCQKSISILFNIFQTVVTSTECEEALKSKAYKPI